jgi:glycosyltransferase involved in cell wall biosynthesis
MLSVITVVYNNFNHIEDTILNVLKLKENTSLEYIIVDGGSTDGTIDVIEKYRNEISCFISEPDKGIYDAMNKGIDLAKGEWLIFMNSGDLFYNNTNQFLNLNFLDNENVKEYDIIYGNTLTKNGGKIVEVPKLNIRPSYFFLDTICHQSVFFNKKIFNNVGYYNLDYKIISDRDLLFRVAKSNGKFHHVDHIISVWDEEGFSKENISLFRLEDLLFIQQNFRLLERNYLFFKRRFKSALKKILK